MLNFNDWVISQCVLDAFKAPIVDILLTDQLIAITTAIQQTRANPTLTLSYFGSNASVNLSQVRDDRLPPHYRFISPA